MLAFKFNNAVVGLELQAGVLLNLLVPLQGWDASFGVVINAVAGLGLQAVVLLSLVVLLAFKFINAVV